MIENFRFFVNKMNISLNINRLYNKKDIWWHAEQPWIFGMPLHNYICVFLLCGSGYLSGNKELVKSGLVFAATIGSYVLYSLGYN